MRIPKLPPGDNWDVTSRATEIWIEWWRPNRGAGYRVASAELHSNWTPIVALTVWLVYWRGLRRLRQDRAEQAMQHHRAARLDAIRARFEKAEEEG